MTLRMSNEPSPQSEVILYQTEDGRTRIQCRFEGETIWLTQALIAALFQKDARTINEHLVSTSTQSCQAIANAALLKLGGVVGIGGAIQQCRECGCG